MPEVVAEYIFRDMADGEFWIDILVDRQPYGKIGPFETESDRQKAHDELIGMTRSLGARDLPLLPQ